MGRGKSRKHEKLKPNPRPGPDIIDVSKGMAGVSQLETAIRLWFQNGEPIPTYALAIAAHDCLNGLSSAIGKPSRIQEWLDSMPEDFKARATYFQNFIKHGFKDTHEKCPYSPRLAEIIIISAILCYESAFGTITALMHLFMTRYFIENPTAVIPERQASFFNDVILKMDHPKLVEREDFFRELFGPLTIVMQKRGMQPFHVEKP